jgi:glycosyltransferase involved in cell wall biosynthesis
MSPPSQASAAQGLGQPAEREYDFSIIIPTRNEEGYIGRSLSALRRSIEASSFSVELIVVDGFSTDRTVDEARPYADLVLADLPLAGASIGHARNLGAAAAHGRLLFHTDADVFIPNTEQFFRSLAHCFQADGVVAAEAPVMPYPWDSTGRDVIIHKLANAFFRSSLWYGALFSRGECQVIRRNAFDAVGGYRGRFVSGEDCDLFRRLHKLGRIAYLSDLCVYHSMRRFRHIGYVKVLGIYVREWLWMQLFDRSFVHEWRVVR